MTAPKSRLEQIVERVQAIATGPNYLFGIRELRLQRRLPSVAWVPDEDSFGSTANVGGVQRQKLTVNAGLDAHIWAETLAQTEAVRDALILAALTVANGSVQFTRGGWKTQQAVDAGWTIAGELYVLSLSFAMPVHAPADTHVTIEAVAIDPTDPTPGDGVLQAG